VASAPDARSVIEAPRRAHGHGANEGEKRPTSITVTTQ